MGHIEAMRRLARSRQATENLFVLLDGASHASTFGAVFYYEGAVNYRPLFLKTYYESVMEHGPILVETRVHTPFFSWFCADAPENNTGIVVFSTHSFQALADQYKQFLTVSLPDGPKAILRFYDPRITLRAMWLMNEAELSVFRRNVSGIYVPRRKTDGSVYWRDLLEQGADNERG